MCKIDASRSRRWCWEYEPVEQDTSTNRQRSAPASRRRGVDEDCRFRSVMLSDADRCPAMLMQGTWNFLSVDAQRDQASRSTFQQTTLSQKVQP